MRKQTVKKIKEKTKPKRISFSKNLNNMLYMLNRAQEDEIRKKVDEINRKYEKLKEPLERACAISASKDILAKTYKLIGN